MRISYDELKHSAMEELWLLRLNATEEEWKRLVANIDGLNGSLIDQCVYGYMTGSCFSKRASELIEKCAGETVYRKLHTGDPRFGPVKKDKVEARFWVTAVEVLLSSYPKELKSVLLEMREKENAVLIEASNELYRLKQATTRCEWTMLMDSIHLVNGRSNTHCVYGMIAGNCESKRAHELMNACAGPRHRGAIDENILYVKFDSTEAVSADKRIPDDFLITALEYAMYNFQSRMMPILEELAESEPVAAALVDGW